MKNRIFTLITLIVILISLGACKPAETRSEPTEAMMNNADSQNPVGDTSGDQSYPVATIVKPAEREEFAYPITQGDLQMLYKTWTLTSAFVDGVDQANQEKVLEFNSDNSFEITTSGNTISGEWTARLFATESNLVLKMADGSLFSYQIVDLKEDSLILSSIQDGQQVEEHFTPLNW